MTNADAPEPGSDGGPTEPPGVSPPGGQAEAELRTFLIADIRGYTTYTQKNGADAAAELAGRFAAIVREVVTAHDGFLLELRGDEALVVFVLARRALRAALELQARFAAELARGVGIGLDAGEAIPVEGGYRGSALNLAARLCGQAGPGETLASEAVIHLAAKVEGVGYADPRTYRLKGIEQPIRAMHIVVPELGSKKPIRYGGDGRRPDRRLLAAGGVGLAALALVAVVVSGALGGSGGTAPSPSGAAAAASRSPAASPELVAYEDLPAIAYLDPATGQATSIKRVDERVELVAFDDGAFWLASPPFTNIVALDPATHERIRVVSHPVTKPQNMAVADGIMWVNDFDRPRVVGVDVATSRVVHDYDLPSEDGGGATGLAFADGSLWVGTRYSEELFRLDPATGDVEAAIPVAAQVLASDGDLLIAQSSGKLHRIDMARNVVLWSTAEITTPSIWTAVAFGGGYIWVSDDTRGTVTKVEPATGKVARVFDVGVGALPMAAAGNTLWVAVQDAGRLVAIDMTTGETRDVELGHFIGGLAASDGELLVSLDRTGDDVIAHLSGDILTITAPTFPFGDPDPARNGSFQGRQAAYTTCAGLLRYADMPAPEGWTLVPEVAVALPDVSADGTTYTFAVRPGWKFSDGQALTAETYRSSIERALSPELDSFFGRRYAPPFVGLQAYLDGTATHVEGIAVDGERITFTLAEPAGDFLDLLTLPWFCPVPIGTPAVPNLDPKPPLPSAGPYYLAEHLAAELAVFKRNPNYAGDRPQPFDAIVFREGVEPGTAVSLVDAGTYDAVADDTGELGAQSVLARTWGPGSDNAVAGDQRWFGGARPATGFLALNPADPLLKDPQVRRAISLALDRTALAAPSNETPSDRLLSPAVRGSALSDPPVPAPDLEAARELMAGRTGTLVLAAGPEGECATCDARANAVVGQLAAIGLTVEIKRHPWAELEAVITAPDSTVDLWIEPLWADYPDPVAMLRGLHDLAALPEGDLAELDRLEALAGQERVDAAVALATKVSETDHLVLPFAYPVYPMYLGDDVGCAFVQPAIGAVDLLSLCRKP